MSESASKPCSGPCGQVRPLSDFYVARSRPDGRQAQCKDCQRTAGQARKRAQYDADPEGMRALARADYAANREARLSQTRSYQADIRARVLAHYGERCSCCGSTENLEIDHIFGGGADHRRALFGTSNSTMRLLVWLVRNDFPAGFQTLCRVCNQCKGQSGRCILHADPATLTAAEMQKLRQRKKAKRWRTRTALGLVNGP